uniref:NAD kinase n=1 Tax=Ignisphaera aggregans TaxID=334771 RepID=A0A7C2VE72_9CREN
MVIRMKVGVVVKRGSDSSYKVAEELLRYGSRVLGLDMAIEREVSDVLPWDSIFDITMDKVDLLVVVGGDGTLLRAVQRLRFLDTPLVGIRSGRRGFLLDVEPSEAPERLRDIVEGRYEIKEYMLLKIILNSGAECYALNDLLVASTRNTRSSIITLEVYVDDEPLYRFDGDGVIISTPLGSSAYTFSAGGPVVDSDMNAMVVTPLAPLQTNARPVVLAPNRVVKIVNAGDSEEALCIVDGETKRRLSPLEEIVVSRFEQGVRIVRFGRFNTIRRVRACEF